MIMIMARITMGRNHNLEPISPKLLGKSHADIVCGFCIHLVSLERLVAVVADSAASLAISVLSFHELFRRVFLACQIEASHKRPGLCLHLISSVFDDTLDFVKLREVSLIMRLFRVSGVVDYLVYSTFNRPNRCDCH